MYQNLIVILFINNLFCKLYFISAIPGLNSSAGLKKPFIRLFLPNCGSGPWPV